MKKYTCCVITILVLLSGCKQEGEVKVTLTTTYKSGVRPDIGSNIYFMPVDSIDLSNTFQYWDDANFNNTVEALTFYTETSGNSITWLQEKVKKASDKTVIDSLKMMINFIDSAGKAKRQQLPGTEVQERLSNDNIAALANIFKKAGTRLTTDEAGTCTAILPAGKYRVLIESNSCLRKRLPAGINSYYLDSVTVLPGKVSAINTQLIDCME